jgi:hypothetical protein
MSVVATRQLRQSALEIATVPEIAVAENYDALPDEHNVGVPWERRNVQPIT